MAKMATGYGASYVKGDERKRLLGVVAPLPSPPTMRRILMGLVHEKATSQKSGGESIGSGTKPAGFAAVAAKPVPNLPQSSTTLPDRSIVRPKAPTPDGGDLSLGKQRDRFRVTLLHGNPRGSGTEMPVAPTLSRSQPPAEPTSPGRQGAEVFDIVQQGARLSAPFSSYPGVTSSPHMLNKGTVPHVAGGAQRLADAAIAYRAGSGEKSYAQTARRSAVAPSYSASGDAVHSGAGAPVSAIGGGRPSAGQVQTGGGDASAKAGDVQPAATEGTNAQQAPAQGDVYLDGTLMGRWMSRTLAADAARPANGSAGFDPRRSVFPTGTMIGG